MNLKNKLTIILAGLSMSVFADVGGNNYTQNMPDGTNLMNVENATNLNAKFVSNKKMNNISDASSIVKMFNLNLVIQGQSANQKTGTVQIVSNGTVRDYLNILGDQFGYYWTLNGNNVVFSPINPVVAKPTPVVQVAPTPIVSSFNLESKEEVKPVQTQDVVVVKTVVPATNQVTKTPTTPIIEVKSITPDKNFGVWEVKMSDKTIKKALQRWAKDSGWQLIWNADVDFPVSASMTIDGDFDYAVNEVCRASQFTDSKIIGEFHPKNKVIVISTQDL